MRSTIGTSLEIRLASSLRAVDMTLAAVRDSHGRQGTLRRIDMWARVSTYEGHPDQADAAASRLPEDELRQMTGFERAYLLIDRTSGKGMTISFWDSQDSLLEGEERANELRRRVAEDLGASEGAAVDRFEVAGVIEK
jgi:heme-degrading monooxygenase HmoA